MLPSMDFDPQGTHISVFYSLVQFHFSLQTLRRTSFAQCFFLTLAPLILKTFAGLHKFFSTFHHIEPTLFLNPLLSMTLWNLETIPPNNERPSLVNSKFPTKKLANCSPYFTALQVISNLETRRSYSILQFQNYSLFWLSRLECLQNR